MCFPASVSSMRLLLWLLLLLLDEPTEGQGPDWHGSEGHDFGEVQDYEVVRPIRLHSVRRVRQTQGGRPQTLHYAMTVAGKVLEMQLEKNNELLGQDYTETAYTEGGDRVTTAPDDIDNCYYQGRVLNDSQSAVSISTCAGLRGYFRTAAQRYAIEPLSGTDEGEHAVTTFRGNASTPAVCGVTNTSWSSDYEPPTGRSRSGGISILQRQKYIQLFLVTDHRQYQKMGRDQRAVRQRIFEIVNFVNMVYKPLRTFIALVGLEIWSNRDLISITPPAGNNLEAFMKWRNSELLERKKHDNAHLISGIDFEGSTVGLAFVGTMCSGHSVGVVQDHNNNAIAVGATLAHEMGHNLGMNHDDSSRCICSGDSCIMAAALSWNIPRTFSSCSSSNYENYLTSRQPGCLMDKPSYLSLETPAVCGNGFLEQGEQCDCGALEECANPCCNATTCMLKQGAQCADGECCENCKVTPRGKECRAQQDECDLAEHCDGKSDACPEDVFGVNGLPCDGGRGYCHNGQCPQRGSQCHRMYGASAVEGDRYCYNQNTRGTYFAFCKWPSQDTYIPCQPEDVMCGKLFCQGGQSDPNYGRMVSFGRCKAAFFEDFKADFGQVDPGTRCGDGKVCSQNECVDLETAYRNTNCSAKCRGHAVCNHYSKCQCEAGWVEPDCTSKEESSSSLSTGVTIGIVVALSLVLLGILAAVFGVIWKNKQLAPPPPSQTQWKPAAPSRPAPRHQMAPPPAVPTYQLQGVRPKPRAAPPPPPPAGNRPKPPTYNYMAARQALKPVPPPKV